MHNLGLMHELALPLLVGLIVVALAFDFLNGLHDAANSIATVVGNAAAQPRGGGGLRCLLQFRAPISSRCSGPRSTRSPTRSARA